MSLLFDPNYTILTEERSWKLFNQILVASQIFGGLAIVCVAIWMGSYGGYGWTEDPEREFHYHPTFMVMGMVFLYGESIIIYRVFRNERKKFTKLLHAALHSMVLIFMIIALKAVWDSHDLHRGPDGALDPLPNLISLHSWIGITTVIAFCGQYALGFSSFLYPGLSMTTRQIIMPFHQLFGLVIFGMVSLTVALGISEKAAWAHTCWTKGKEMCGQQLVSNFVGVSVFLYSLCIVILVGNPRWRRKPLPEEEMLHGMNMSSSRDPMD
ncbi:unnamed protein product, partial [Mesorhabditis spiculigera]